MSVQPHPSQLRNTRLQSSGRCTTSENPLGRRALLHGSLAVGATIASSALLPQLAGAATSADVQRNIVILTCMDYRIDPLTFSDIGVWTAHSYIVRNAGGRVDE